MKNNRVESDLVESPPVIRRHRRIEPDDEVYSESSESESDSSDERFTTDMCLVAHLDDRVVEVPQPLPEFDGAVVQPRQGVRQSRRVAQNGLRAAFQFLATAEYDNFLGRPIIKQLFAPAFEAFTKFGQGHAAGQIENHWLLHWTNHLQIQSVFRISRGLAKLANDNPDDQRYQRNLQRFQTEVADSHCLFCRLRRNLTVCTYDTSGEVPVYLGLVGADCWTIRFQPLLDLVDTCRRLALSVDHPDFELIARRHIDAGIQKIVTAPAAMAEAYQHLRK
jgi:hypothetical protein